MPFGNNIEEALARADASEWISGDILDGDLREALDLAAQSRANNHVANLRHEVERRIEEDLLAIPGVAGALMAELAEQSERRAATHKSYRRRHQKFVQWAASKGFEGEPYPPSLVARYFVEEFARGVSMQSVLSDRAAIKYFAHQGRHADPTADPICKVIIAHLRKLEATPTKTKQPETKE